MTEHEDTQTSENNRATDSSIGSELTRKSSRNVRPFGNRAVPSGTWGYTYFVQRGDLIKIGHSGAPKQRMKAYGKTSKVLAIIPNTIIEEGAAHKKFHHLREINEWFRTAPELLEFIEWAKSEAEPTSPGPELAPMLIARKRAPKTSPGLKGQLAGLLWAYEHGDPSCKEGVGFYMKKTLSAFNAEDRT